MADRMYENNEMQSHYEKTRKKPAMEQPGQDMDGEKDMDDVVAEHGPAEHMEMHSHHKDGHVHKATHHDAHGAHEHVSKAFEEGEESDGMKKPAEPAAEPMPMGIPGM